MLEYEDIEQQIKLLTISRRTLGVLLQQQAAFGSPHTPPVTIHGILEARNNIQRIKSILRESGIVVEDYPDDEDFNSQTKLKDIASSPEAGKQEITLSDDISIKTDGATVDKPSRQHIEDSTQNNQMEIAVNELPGIAIWPPIQLPDSFKTLQGFRLKREEFKGSSSSFLIAISFFCILVGALSFVGLLMVLNAYLQPGSYVKPDIFLGPLLGSSFLAGVIPLIYLAKKPVPVIVIHNEGVDFTHYIKGKQNHILMLWKEIVSVSFVSSGIRIMMVNGDNVLISGVLGRNNRIVRLIRREVTHLFLPGVINEYNSCHNIDLDTFSLDRWGIVVGMERISWGNAISNIVMNESSLSFGKGRTYISLMVRWRTPNFCVYEALISQIIESYSKII